MTVSVSSMMAADVGESDFDIVGQELVVSVQGACVGADSPRAGRPSRTLMLASTRGF